MTSTVLNSQLFGDMFGDKPMRELFSDETLIRLYLKIEAALAKVQARLGIIPDNAAEEIARQAVNLQIDWGRLKIETENVGYPVLPLVTQLVSACRNNLGQYYHWGATTQDIMVTANALQIRDGLLLLSKHIDQTRSLLAGLAQNHRNTVMPGRTHLQQALPVTFGLKCATW